MKQYILSISLFFVSLSSFSQGQGLGEVIGTVKESDSSASMSLVWINDEGRIYSTETDQNGRFRISGVPAGKHLLKATNYIDTTERIVNVPIDGFGNTGVITYQVTKLDIIEITSTEVELKLAINSTPVYKISSEDIKKMPIKFDTKAMIAAMSSEVKMNENGGLEFRGSRQGEMLYYVDGMKLMQVENLPSCSINNMIVYTGGVPAKYGDTLGGVVVVETKSYFDLLREYKIANRE